MIEQPFVDWAWLMDHLDEIVYRTFQHLVIALVAVALGTIISFALAYWTTRTRRVEAPVTMTAGVIYTIPSLALFVALVPVTGLSLLTVEIPLVLYTVLILYRNMVAGFDGVPADVREAADAMGYSPGGRLWQVELPLAIPLIMAGVRLATVSTIGLTMIATTIGDNYGGLGYFIRDGISRFFPTELYLGAILAIGLAVGADIVLVRIERILTPWVWVRTRSG